MLRVIAEFLPRSWFASGPPPSPEEPFRVARFLPPPYWVPGQQFRLYPPGDYRPSLLVETHAELDDEELHEARLRLANLGCSLGLLFDVRRAVVLRDSLQDGDPSETIELVHELETQAILSRFAPVTRASLDQDVERWLQKLTSSWTDAVSKGLDRHLLSGLLEDVAPAAQGAEIRPIPLAA